jgi:hypothetical protein
MLARALIGLGAGGGAGALYGAFGRCAGGSCHIQWNATVPTVVGALGGLFVVLCSKWD